MAKVVNQNADLKMLRRLIIEAAAVAGEGHIPSAFSVLDILYVLYDRVLRFDPINPRDPDRDWFFLSKGHASLALYAVLASKNFFPKSELNSFASFGSFLGGHPDCNKVPGVEASTGSLGHGLPMAIGTAMALKIKNLSSRVYCIVGDGECNEGSIWESALLAAHHQLSNLVCIVDHNHSGDRALSMGNFAEKFSAFGWATSVVDGHDHEHLFSELNRADHQKPLAIIAETIKGKGCRTLENNPAWHHKAPSSSELPLLLGELS